MNSLVEFSRHEFRLGKLGSDGKTLRETLDVVARAKGVMPEEGINPVSFPEAVGHVWEWFLHLNASRQAGMGGPMPVTYTEIAAFFNLEGVELSGWELQAIRWLDRIALEPIADEA